MLHSLHFTGVVPMNGDVLISLLLHNLDVLSVSHVVLRVSYDVLPISHDILPVSYDFLAASSNAYL